METTGAMMLSLPRTMVAKAIAVESKTPRLGLLLGRRRTIVVDARYQLRVAGAAAGLMLIGALLFAGDDLGDLCDPCPEALSVEEAWPGHIDSDRDWIGNACGLGGSSPIRVCSEVSGLRRRS